MADKSEIRIKNLMGGGGGTLSDDTIFVMDGDTTNKITYSNLLDSIIGDIYHSTASFTDFNDCPRNTAWWINTEVTTGNNPSNRWGVLEFYSTMQRFTEYNGDYIYIRFYISSDWKEWIRFSRDGSYGILLPEGADLNDYKTPGRYYTSNGSHSATILNIPTEVTGSGFILDVSAVSSIGVSQKITMSASAFAFFLRGSSSNGWQDWYKFSGTLAE